MEKNHGYTMIEMIIVIAIMAILTAMAFANLGIVKEAKCTAAATSLDNQITALYTQTMALSDVKSDDTKLCMRIWNGQPNGNRTATKIEIGYVTGGTFTAKTGIDPVWLSDVVNEVTYTPSAAVQEHAITQADEKQFIIMFNKSNSAVVYGAGDYEVKYNGRVMAKIHLDAVTGRHSVK